MSPKNASDERGMTTPADPAIGVDASHGRRLVAGSTASAQQRHPGSSPVPQVVRSVTAAHPSVAGRKAASRNGSHGEPGGCVAHVAPATPSHTNRNAAAPVAPGRRHDGRKSVMQTLPIPAEIVGDTESLDQRFEDIRSGAYSWGNTLAHNVRDGRPVDNCVRQIAAICAPIDAMHAERMRRFDADRMSKAIQPEGSMWRR